MRPPFNVLRALLAEPRGRMLSLEGVGALLLAWSIADDDGVIRCGPDASYALSFIAQQHALSSADPDNARNGAEGACGELLQHGLIQTDGPFVRLAGWATPARRLKGDEP